MNKRIWLAALMAGTLVGSALTVFAQDSQPPAGGDNGPQAGQDGGHPGMGEGGPQGMMNLHRMKDKLGLTDDQVAKLKTLFDSQREAGKPLMDQTKIDMDTLQQKVDTKASDVDLKKALDVLSGDRKAMEANRQKMEDQLRQILTPFQQAKWVLSMRMGGGQMGNWMQHRKDGQGGNNAGGDSGKTPGGN